MTTCRKVERLEIKEVDIDLQYINKLHKILSEQNEKTHKFISKVKHLSFSKIGFTGHPDNIGFVIVKFCQALRLFTSLESIDFIEFSRLP